MMEYQRMDAKETYMLLRLLLCLCGAHVGPIFSYGTRIQNPYGSRLMFMDMVAEYTDEV